MSERASSLRSNSSLAAAESAGAPQPAPPPEVEGIDDYVSKRLEEQIGWYEDRARQFASKAAFWKKVGYVLGAVATILGGATSLGWELPGQLTAWIPVVTTATGAIGSFLHAGRFEALIATYRDTARQLRYRWVRFKDLQERSREAELQLVADCESIMSSENDAWRVEWQSSAV